MFGVLEYTTPAGGRGFLYAFSGQYFGIWEVPGWVPPVFAVDEFFALNTSREREIAALTRKINCLAESDLKKQQYKALRRNKSRCLAEKLWGLYRLKNFAGKERSLREAWFGDKGVPTGTGDCCAPKLLQAAAREGLLPLGLCEIFIGREPKSAIYSHGTLASPCLDRCAPLLGFLLCGHTRRP
jgi:hypothetical protein